jgi:hypothetical protein
MTCVFHVRDTGPQPLFAPRRAFARELSRRREDQDALANLTDWPDAKVEALRLVLKGETAILSRDGLRIERSLPHGHVAAVLGMARKLGLAMIVARVIEPAAKLATARQLSDETAAHSSSLRSQGPCSGNGSAGTAFLPFASGSLASCS